MIPSLFLLFLVHVYTNEWDKNNLVSRIDLIFVVQ